ncbi:putative bifunctional tRNA threonylcarbamoyladenosine biosynthesis protein [uncultured archaeon]|nr:putative bifunctional tRNA threonylcarbamoyladenosine biosynthesis protein [uncultured archaeon]
MAEHHAKTFPAVLANALQQLAEHKLGLSDVRAVAYSQSPGIGHCLHVGFTAARALAARLDVPLIPVNHAVAHIEVVNGLQGAKDPLVVYVSGGNSQLLRKQLVTKPLAPNPSEGPALKTKTARASTVYRHAVLGETMDVGVGNFVDNVGRFLQLEPPDAVGVLKLAPESKQLLDLPYTVKGMNLSFTGLLTALQTYYDEHKARAQKAVAGGANASAVRELKADVANAAQELAFAQVCEAAERALCHTGQKAINLCGGNARNRRLQAMLQSVCDEHGASFYPSPDQYSGDQGAMIAYVGARYFAAGRWPKAAGPQQRLRADQIDVYWP